MMRWGRDETDARYAMASFRNHLVNLESWQLASLARFGSLSHLYLYLFGIDKILGSDTKSSACHLFGLRAEADSVTFRIETLRVLTALTSVAACSQLVHGKTDSLVSLFAQSTKRHSTRNKSSDDTFYRFYLVERYRILLPLHEVADEYGRLFLVYQPAIFLEFGIVTCTCRLLESGYGVGVPGMSHSVSAPMELAMIGQGLFFLCRVYGVTRDGILGYLLQSNAAYAAGVCTKICLQYSLAESNALKDFCAAI